jgi:hypothetical protein
VKIAITFGLALAAALVTGCGGGATPAAPSARCFPLMFDPGPRGTLPAGTRSTTLAMATDRAAVCRYAREEGLLYSQMVDVFAVSGGTQHRTPFGDLIDGGVYRLFAKCEVPGTSCTTPHDLFIVFDVARPARGALRQRGDDEFPGRVRRHRD